MPRPSWHPGPMLDLSSVIHVIQRLPQYFQQMAIYLENAPMPSRNVTISSGVITLTGRGLFTVDTEGAASTDDLDTISGTTAGDEFILQIADSSRDVRITESGNISLGAFGEFTLGDISDKARFVNRDGTNIDAISLRNNS